MPVSRRQFLKSAAAVSIGFAGLHRHLAWGAPAPENSFGPLVPDPGGILDLPKGFSYRVLSRAGELMDDGLRLPGAADGMAAFPGPEGRVVLVRNHELSPGAKEAGAFGDDNEKLGKLPKEDLYDWGQGEMPGLRRHHDPRVQRANRCGGAGISQLGWHRGQLCRRANPVA